jgi:hypothetical protein
MLVPVSLNASRGNEAVMRRRATITIETTTLVVVRGGSAYKAWCHVCAAEREMLALGDVDVLPSIDRLSVERWLEASGAHIAEGHHRDLLICLPSLLAAAGRSEHGSVVRTLPAIGSRQRLAKANDKERS